MIVWSQEFVEVAKVLQEKFSKCFLESKVNFHSWEKKDKDQSTPSKLLRSKRVRKSKMLLLKFIVTNCVNAGYGELNFLFGIQKWRRSAGRQSLSSVRPLEATKTPKNWNKKNRKHVKLSRAVYPPRMAPIGLKICQRPFQVISNIWFFDPQNFFGGHFLTSKFFGRKFLIKCLFWRN